MKKILCYVALVVLIVLIILPPALRIFVKDDGSDDKPRDVMELLNCKRGEEEINMPYKNGGLTSIKYRFMDTGDGSTNETGTLKSVLVGIGNTQIENSNGEVTYRLDLTLQNNAIQVPDEFKRTSEVMKDYYTNLGYSCNIMK